MLIWLTDFHALLIAALLPLAGFLALAFFGRMRNASFFLSAGRESFALKRIEVFVTDYY